MFHTIKKYHPLFISALFLMQNSAASEMKPSALEESKAVPQGEILLEPTNLTFSYWESIIKWDELIKQDKPFIVPDFEKDKKVLYWALDRLDKVFGTEFSLVIQKTFIDVFIEYMSHHDNMDDLEESLFALGNLEGDLRTYFGDQIRMEGWFVQRKALRHDLYRYSKACDKDDSLKAIKRGKFRSLFQKAFSNSYHSIWDFKYLERDFFENPYYQGLSMDGREYTSEQLIKIGKKIKEYNISYLLIGKDAFSVAPMSSLAEGLKGITSLTSLYFYEVKINKKGGFDDFVNAIDNLQGLTELNMKSCGIDDSNHDTFTHLISEAKNLKRVELGFNSLSERTQLSLFDTLKTNQFAGKITLNGFKFTLDSITALADILAKNTPITSLDVGYTKGLSSDFLEMILRSLWANQHVIELRISNNTLDQMSGAVVLGRLLQENKVLQSLDMGCLKIQPDQMVEIAQGLSQNISLTDLSLSEDNYGTIGTQALAKALCVHPTLKHISLWDNKLTDQNVATLLTFLQSNRSIERLKIDRSTFGMEAAQQFKTLFPHNHTIKELVLSYVEMTDALLEVLCMGIHPDTSLTKIEMGGHNDLRHTLPLARVVWKTPQIKSVRFYNSRTMDEKSAYAFSYITATRKEDKFDCYIDGYNRDIIQELAMKKKERVLKSLEAIQYYPEQELLNLNYLKFQGEESKQIFQTEEGQYQSIDKLHLKKVTFDEESVNHLILFLKSKPNLIEFSICGSGLESRDLYRVLKGLRDNTVLKYLSIRGENMRDNAAIDILDYLCRTTTLEELDLSKMKGYIHHCKLIAQGLKENKSLKTLHLRGHSLASLMCWVRAFWHHPTLQKVDNDFLWNVSISEDVSDYEFESTLENGSNANSKVLDKVTAIVLFYIKNHKDIDINFRFDMDEKIRPYLGTFSPLIKKYLDDEIHAQL